MVVRLRSTREHDNHAEKAEFEEAKRVSEEARCYAWEQLASARADMTWLEDALTPDRRMRRLDCQGK